MRSDKDILTAVIARAVSNGYDFGKNVTRIEDVVITSFNVEEGTLALVLRTSSKRVIQYDHYKLLFFEMSFAKALFGADWEKHLYELAVTDNILKYLKQTLTL
ncbi:hypothetical protein E1176_18995 [Fulvivirga sp. RKSG066]|uniref:hypothetical protein n=1 Tax=Fulvivirga aurantia TaxID=2529383 RepID=UPI0012BD16E8|nr:hypothetical protein [Fulvivirga aurantia]MTI23124.1 hypothetical protein [Fulvivirga aurantia]